MVVHPRIKGETALPVHTLALLGKIGVTRAAKEIGTSTTTLHKARKSNIVSKVVETAAGHVLEHLGDVDNRPMAAPKPAPRPPAPKPEPRDTMFLLSVKPAQGALVEQFAKLLDAEITSA